MVSLLFFYFLFLFLYHMAEVIKSFAGIQAYIDIFADKLFISREMYKQVVLGTSCKCTFLTVFIFYQDLLNSPLETRRILTAFLLYNGKKTG